MENMKLSELKAKSPAELLVFAEEYEVENASTMRKQELMFAILKELAAREVEITGEGVVEVLPDGFGFLTSHHFVLRCCTGNEIGRREFLRAVDWR